ncbi:unnamed protein product [Penicillium salamii]|uniref:Uncharacterized protein n=1 Tax=Penicillium salamii TaxID=1612424 RepID=A0A9W4K0E5_9EURO|nr:unnamed protein product [Penicillium salamii]
MHHNFIGQSMSTAFDPDYSTPSPQKSPLDLRAASSATSNTSEEIQKKYVQERDKHLKEDGPNQYVDLLSDEKLKHFSQDCWLADDNDQSSLPLQDGSHHRALVIGAGYGGLLFAVRLIEAGFEPKDITIVDSAGGFGGTWYWNRYPGLMCDVESYIYMPLLEETGYMPENRYAYGT